MEKKVLFAHLDETNNRMIELAEAFDEEEMNKVFKEDSWTAAQVTDHVAKAISSVARSLQENGKDTDKNTEAGVQKIKEIFLDFSSKFKSPDFILPSAGPFDKEKLIASLKSSIQQLNIIREKTNLMESISHRVFKEPTKWELLHLALYHTQRHIYQLKNILEIVRNKEVVTKD